MNESVLEKMSSIINDPKSDDFLKSISISILENIDNIDDMQIMDIAKKSHYAVSSITKFCQKLGCKGWKDFKSNLLMHSNYIKSNKKIDNLLFAKDDFQLIENLKNLSINSINETWEKNSKQILKFKNYINYYNRICFYGVGFNKTIIEHFRRSLIFLKKDCVYDIDRDAQQKIAEIEDDNSLHIILSFSGTTGCLIDIIDSINNVSKPNSKNRIVTLTGNPNSYLASHSDLVIQLASNESPLRKVSYQALWFIINATISLLLKDLEGNNI